MQLPFVDSQTTDLTSRIHPTSTQGLISFFRECLELEFGEKRKEICTEAAGKFHYSVKQCVM
ncbi:MAG: hypothetical protein DWI02_10045 [Planctomycetota bacterium]|nr:MAG: hypothetical protein DWI02_10045 [Planctomycetota bacterium]